MFVTPRCKEIFEEVVKMKPELKTFLLDAVTFCGKIDELCDKETRDRVDQSSFQVKFLKLKETEFL